MVSGWVKLPAIHQLINSLKEYFNAAYIYHKQILRLFLTCISSIVSLWQSASRCFLLESSLALLFAFLINVAVIAVSGSVCSYPNISSESKKQCKNITLDSAAFLLKVYLLARLILHWIHCWQQYWSMESSKNVCSFLTYHVETGRFRQVELKALCYLFACFGSEFNCYRNLCRPVYYAGKICRKKHISGQRTTLTIKLVKRYFAGFFRFENEAVAAKFANKMHCHSSKLGGLQCRRICRSWQANHHCFCNVKTF